MKRWPPVAACIALASTYLVWHLAAHGQASGQRVVMGRLTKIGDAAIFVRQNKKMTMVHVRPSTEIWRRGVYLGDVAQLVLGEAIRAAYTEVGADGMPVADLVVASEADDALMMVPHKVVEYRFCAGVLADVAEDSLTMLAGVRGACVMLINKQTEIRRGPLRPGDHVSVLNIVRHPREELVAQKIWVEGHRASSSEAGSG
jgi:hypothetical protein